MWRVQTPQEWSKFCDSVKKSFPFPVCKAETCLSSSMSCTLDCSFCHFFCQCSTKLPPLFFLLTFRVNVGKRKMPGGQVKRTRVGRYLALTADASSPASPGRWVLVCECSSPTVFFFLTRFSSFQNRSEFILSNSSAEGRCYRHRCAGPNRYQIQVSGSEWVDCPGGGTTQVTWQNNIQYLTIAHCESVEWWRMNRLIMASELF